MECEMAFVMPKWRAHNVEAWEDLIVRTDSGDEDLNNATAAILNYMPVIGITRLTEENIEDVWRRIAIHEALFGSFIFNTFNKQPLFLVRSDIARHIGIETEGKQLTFEAFCSMIHHHKLEPDETRLPSYVANGNRTLLSVCLTKGEGNSGDD